MNNLAAKQQQRRLKLWRTPKRDQENLILTILESEIGIIEKREKGGYKSKGLQKRSGNKKPNPG